MPSLNMYYKEATHYVKVMKIVRDLFWLYMYLKKFKIVEVMKGLFVGEKYEKKYLFYFIFCSLLSTITPHVY